MNRTEKKSFWARPAVQSITASLLCILLGLLIGFVVLLFINAKGSWNAIVTILKNYMTYPTLPAAKNTWAIPWLRQLPF